MKYAVAELTRQVPLFQRGELHGIGGGSQGETIVIRIVLDFQSHTVVSKSRAI